MKVMIFIILLFCGILCNPLIIPICKVDASGQRTSECTCGEWNPLPHYTSKMERNHVFNLGENENFLHEMIKPYKIKQISWNEKIYFIYDSLIFAFQTSYRIIYFLVCDFIQFKPVTFNPMMIPILVVFFLELLIIGLTSILGLIIFIPSFTFFMKKILKK